MNWLFKEEPANYSFDALVKENSDTVWSGVKNPLAQKHLHAVKKGDRIFYYHTGAEKAVVGIATARGHSYDDPSDPTGKQAVVDIAPVKKLARPVTLSEIKANPAFKDFALVRISRLSVMPVSDAEWTRIEQLANAPAGETGGAGGAGKAGGRRKGGGAAGKAGPTGGTGK